MSVSDGCGCSQQLLSSEARLFEADFTQHLAGDAALAVHASEQRYESEDDDDHDGAHLRAEKE